MITLYGIKNCDTCRKARKWLAENGVEHRYHDLREDGLDADRVTGWLEAIEPEILINRRGTSWRQLPEDVRANLDRASAAALAVENPTLVKRPVIDNEGAITVGFTADIQKTLS